VQLRYTYRAYPDALQRRASAQAFGCARVVWNDCLRDRVDTHDLLRLDHVRHRHVIRDRLVGRGDRRGRILAAGGALRTATARWCAAAGETCGNGR
jgi:hypothetical protein